MTSIAAVAARLVWPVETSRLRLRPIGPEDAAAVHEYRSRPEVVRYLSHAPLTRAQCEDFARWGASKPPQPGKVRLRLIAELRDGRVIGDAMLRLAPAPTLDAPTADVEAEIGYTIHPEFTGQGFATEIGAALLTVAFGPAGARRVTADVAGPHTASHRVLAKLGLRQEGVRRQAWRCQGQWIDAVDYGLLRQEWEERQPFTTG